MTAMAPAIWTSIGIGVIVQVIALLLMMRFKGEGFLLGWGIGTLLRLVTLMAYALGIAPALGFPLTPALLSLVAVFFVTMLIEPFLLNSRGSAPQNPLTDK